MRTEKKEILRVYRTKAQAKKYYDRMSRFYGFLSGIFEKKYRDAGLELLGVRRGEAAVEIGFGTGHSLKRIAISVGEGGMVCGIDLSPVMLECSKRRLKKAGLLDRVSLLCEDAVRMPYGNDEFDAVFMSFTLELFDTPEIPRVLGESKRVLKKEGRLGIVGMSKEGKGSLLLKVYEWTHVRFPRYFDCRPIFVENSLREAGFEIDKKKRVKLFGLPVEIVVGIK
jgi:demethylmenaquinone methyltransferase/2-methoxy-6-polyprenyl-1,4-benzoquinol methylase